MIFLKSITLNLIALNQSQYKVSIVVLNAVYPLLSIR